MSCVVAVLSTGHKDPTTDPAPAIRNADVRPRNPTPPIEFPTEESHEASMTNAFVARRRLQINRFALSEAINDAYRFVRPYLEMREVSFEFDSPSHVTPISAERNLIIQALTNLFQNAADAMGGCSQRRLRVFQTSRRPPSN
jgi:hypothetical protein